MLVSSHLLAEIQQLVDRVVIINHGRLVREGTLDELAGLQGQVVSLRTPQAGRLREALTRAAGNGVRVH